MSDSHADGAAQSLLRPAIIIPFTLTALIWGGTWFAIKDQLHAAPASWSVTWRFAVAAMGMGVLVLARRQSFRLSREGHVVAALFGLTQFCLNFNLLYRAEAYLTSGIVAVMFAMLMLPNALLGRVFLGIRVPGRFVAGTLVALAGIGLLLLHEAQVASLAGGLASGGIAKGIALACASILAASAANVMQAGQTARRQPILAMLFWALLWGALGDFGIAWVLAGPPVLPLDARYVSGVLYLGIMGSVVTFPLYFTLIRELGPGRAAYNGVVVPIVAMLISTLAEGYRWSLVSAAGAVLALLGMVLALRARSPSR
ncbi:DMT family transporter [Altererythrobacter sp. CC-YST694]|uniref:DMT family transporter n=1 Tax=Altererythrobacter sp. CC-YST694 TaxID=2755038 RepID=UPI001D008343|nr:DMT family transporter [Altererythrobacter sp. CC-YST694]MCB5425291.1 DMT family transporter [Altererythrobacter sp. CC-YST694]